MMPADIPTNSLERQIAQWRDYMHRRVAIHTVAIHTVDVAMLEARLREQLDSLVASGLDVDEAFLVAVKRMGTMDQLSRQFAREQSGRLWKQLVVASSDPLSGINPAQDAKVAWGLAVAAALLVKLPVLFGLELDSHAGFYVRNAGFFVLPLLAIYFAWKRKLDVNTVSKLGL
ncbi:MAG TPA: hypothetical protein VFG52_02410, partial [Xanthomonadales bacterium]|nr:hypothetical protein [Xanthomonadales bacterium]